MGSWWRQTVFCGNIVHILIIHIRHHVCKNLNSPRVSKFQIATFHNFSFIFNQVQTSFHIYSSIKLIANRHHWLHHHHYQHHQHVHLTFILPNANIRSGVDRLEQQSTTTCTFAQLSPIALKRQCDYFKAIPCSPLHNPLLMIILCFVWM